MAKAAKPGTKATEPKGKGKAAARTGGRPKGESLAPRTKKEPPLARRPLYQSPRPAGVRVTEDTALTLGAVWACVKVISEDLAGLPWRVHEHRADGGSELRREDPADWLLNTQTSPETPAFQFRETMVAHALTWGNGYAEIERDGAGRPVWMWLLTPERVCPERAPDGRIVYQVRNPTGPPTTLEADDVYHLRGLGFDGLVGYSVIQLAARSIGAGIALDQATTDLFANDSTPGGVLEHPGKLSEPASKRLSEDWERRHMGPGKRRRVAVLEEGMKWNQTGLPPDDTKLIEQRQFTPADVCRWFRVSPVKIQDLLRATFSNIEELAIWHVTDTLLPWANRLEQEADIKLFGRTNRGKRYTAVDFKALLRGKIEAQTDHAVKMLGFGVYDINEARDYLDRNPIGPDGKKRFVPVNMQLLEKAGEEPPGQPGPGSGAKPKQPGGMPNEPTSSPRQQNGPRADAGAVLRPVFEDACRRLLRAESERAKSALKNGGDPVAWVEKIRTDHAVYVRNQLRPAASALALAHGVEPAKLEPALGVVADAHIDSMAARLATVPESEGDAALRAGALIEQLVVALEAAR
jgi:HK97 family phage portal protein